MLNRMYFNNEDVKKGLHIKFLDTLTSYNTDSENRKNDIHIYSEDNDIIVEWFQKSDKYDDSGTFEQVRPDQMVLTEYAFPDNHYEWLKDDVEYKEALDEWLKENPGWRKNNFGQWTYDSKTKGEE